jgi:hypothetical protein
MFMAATEKTADVILQSAEDNCPAPSENSGEHWRFCPRCRHELINEKCKLRCPRCHYLMSCSDFDFAG